MDRVRATTGSLDLTPDREAIKMNEAICAHQRFPDWRTITQWLVIPWVDKSLALLVVLATIYPIAMHFRLYFYFGEIVFLSETLLFVVTMVLRRPAVRVSINPLYWLLAFVASCWGLLILSVEHHGRSLVTGMPLLLIYFCSAVMIVWGRLSLGKNIGVVPAQRQIVNRGAYRWVRHPIYTAAILTLIGRTLESYSLLNLFLYSLGIFWFVARTLAEEDFLRTDPLYSAYMQRVRWRWVPGLI
jgi:protein-S-isoprenylcysteine O-methyltransferase Ste14